MLFFLCLPLQDLHGLLHAAEVGMEISHCRLNLTVAQDLHHIGQADSLSQGLGDHDRRGRVAEVVEDEILDSGVFPDLPNHLAQFDFLSSLPQRQHIAVPALPIL